MAEKCQVKMYIFLFTCDPFAMKTSNDSVLSILLLNTTQFYLILNKMIIIL